MGKNQDIALQLTLKALDAGVIGTKSLDKEHNVTVENANAFNAGAVSKFYLDILDSLNKFGE